MIEEGFVRLYAHDFTTLAARAESGVAVDDLVRKRIAEVRSHAQLMDAHKGSGHLAAVVDRLVHEAGRGDVRYIRGGMEVEGALDRRKSFLISVADVLRAPEPAEVG